MLNIEEMKLEDVHDGMQVKAFAALYGANPSDPRFLLSLWRAAEQLRKETGKQVAIRGRRLKLLSSEQLAAYARSGRDTAKRKLARTLHRAECVVIGELPEELRAAHARFIERVGREVAALELQSRRLRRLLEEEQQLLAAREEERKRRVEDKAARRKG